ncbi:MAG TPA: hypothetical protein VFN93_06005 [Gaiellaceae bacterium]|nr:hypothetical protein [Gaiellaceae bacterium]
MAALIGAGGAFAGVWLSGRHERKLEHERWLRVRREEADDARAAAVVELTTHLASALQTIVWFTAAAGMREQRFTEQTILDYDADMRRHLTSTIQSLVGVAHRDAGAFRALERLAEEVWELDARVATEAGAHWTNPNAARARISEMLLESYRLERSLPHRIVGVLRPGEALEPAPAAQDAESSRE